ncbi:hypothetical protein ACTQ1W_13515, partial [Segatella copri]|uniref:hypothetical protein n=1 Tax=Segatella copri TaxID=165179 RepID=UPI003F9E354E
RTEILVPLAAIQAVPIAVIAWYRLHRYAWYRYSAIVIETELGEMLTYYVAAMDEAHAEELATIAFENGEIECMGIQIVSIYAYRA